MIHPGATPQADFAAALLDPERAAPPGLRCRNGSAIGARLAVYRNNVLASLVQALADGFPVVHRLVGDKFFRAMAGVFVRAQPPRSPVLSEYGDGFAGWLADFEPAATLPYLPDVAALERARVKACHAADAPALAPQALASRLAAPGQLHQARVGLHPSLAVIRSDWAVASLWAAHQHEGDEAIAAVLPDIPESALVLRADDDVLVLPIERADAVFVQALQRGCGLGEAVEFAARAAGAQSSFDASPVLSLLIRHGALTDWQNPGDPQ